MTEDHLKLQFRRLKRHYEACTKEIDKVSILDLAHSLRILVEMAKALDELVEAKKIEVKFPNQVQNKKIKAILKDTAFTSVPLASTPQANSGMQVKGLHLIKRALTPEEVKKLYEAGPPQIKNTDLSLEQWLGSEILETKNDKGERIGITRSIFIKRVANILGASHPEGKENEDEYERHLDPFIRELHTIQVANGYPLTYYQLIEIAEVLIKSFENLLV